MSTNTRSSDTLPRSAYPSARALLVEAFHDNPAHVYIAPDSRTRRAKLRWIFQRNLGLQIAVGQGFFRFDEAEPTRVDAMGFWHAPGTHGLSVATMARHGLLLAPLRVGVGVSRRLLDTSAEITRQCTRDLAGSRCWLLNNMIVRAERRGSGLGSDLLADQLARIVAPSGQPAALATQRAENVTFYRRLGFEVTSEETIGTGPHAFVNWIMVARP